MFFKTDSLIFPFLKEKLNNFKKYKILINFNHILYSFVFFYNEIKCKKSFSLYIFCFYLGYVWLKKNDFLVFNFIIKNYKKNQI